MILGIHASVRTGFLNALKEAVEKQCRAVQIFPRRPGAPLVFPSKSETDDLAKFRKERSISLLAVHSVYQPNIASTNQKIWERSRDSLLEEFQLAEAIGAEFLVIHSGNYSPDSTLKDGIKKSSRTVSGVLKRGPSKTRILIENVAGGERRIGGKFGELKDMLEEIGDKDRTGICFDSAHAFASGYAIQTPSGLEDCLADFEKNLGLDTLLLFHMNDSGAGLGSHKDIHRHIGEGLIGLPSLRKLAWDKRFEDKAGILETPKLPPGSDRLNLKKLLTQ